ncbi:MAG: chloride channel protein [Tepidisphaeraceae bacterium]|jgi:CIC family chloride channel protein
MTMIFVAPAVRFRVLASRFFKSIGLGEDSFILILAVLVGIVTAAAAVGFHELITFIRDLLYLHWGPEFLYGWKGIWLLAVFPTAGGLGVGLFTQFFLRGREGHGIVDVMESVIRTSGFQHPFVAIEKILTSGLTIGTGGSAGAEGPIVQIGAAIASGVGGFFGLARAQMPLLTGCGCAAGISAIFNAPFGGVLFTLEVILQDFSIRAFTPIVVASVIAQVTTLALFERIGRLGHHAIEYQAIFAMPQTEILARSILNWGQVGNFVLLGAVCGLAGLLLTRTMFRAEKYFHELRLPIALRPALGGALLGVTGIVYILLFGHLLLHRIKPFPYENYPPPAFFGDGYGAVQQLLVSTFPGYASFDGKLLLLLLFLCGIKIVATCLTLASGGSGGIIAPSLFIGATLGGSLGMILRATGFFPHVEPQAYALVGMGAVLAAVVHAPLASILICFELTQDYKVMLPAMLACVVATSLSRVVYADSIYTHGLRQRGLKTEGKGLADLRRMSVEQVTLEPVITVRKTDPFQTLLDLTEKQGAWDFVVINPDGRYIGMIVGDDVAVALMEREAIPLLTCGDLVRAGLPVVKTTEDLASVLESFALYDVRRLPVVVESAPDRVVGMISRVSLMRKYQERSK